MTYHRVKFRRERAFAFTLAEIMVVVAVIALLAVIALPGFMRARKRAQASQVKEDLRLIDAALEQYAIDTGKRSGAPVAMEDWIAYLKKGTRLYATGEDLLGNEFGPQTVDETPMVPYETYIELGDVVDDEFWEPFDL
jgi:prepilin-type N-terminal cleavage/methylation domain-containing protein